MSYDPESPITLSDSTRQPCSGQSYEKTVCFLRFSRRRSSGPLLSRSSSCGTAGSSPSAGPSDRPRTRAHPELAGQLGLRLGQHLDHLECFEVVQMKSFVTQRPLMRLRLTAFNWSSSIELFCKKLEPGLEVQLCLYLLGRPRSDLQMRTTREQTAFTQLMFPTV